MVSELYEKLIQACEKEQVDWAAVLDLINSLGSAINDRYEDGTILSELYRESDSYRQGWKLLEMTKLFLSAGYDVRANNGLNGAACLSQLCWSSYDGYVLETAEMLLDAGANPNYRYGDDQDEEGVLDDISWKLGNWHTGYYLTANLFEAYYRMIELAQQGKDYHGIRAGESCVGKQIKGIERISAPNANGNQDERREYYAYGAATPR